MDTANVLVALGGDRGNTVPKYGVTPSEIAVLRSIHGEDAVFDIEPQKSIVRPARVERARLLDVYGGATDGEQNRIVDMLFPGAAARVFERLSELELHEEMFKADRRVVPPAAPEKEEVEEPVADKNPADMTKTELLAFAEANGFEVDEKLTKPKLLEQIYDLLADAEVEDDGIDDMGSAQQELFA